MSCGNIASQGSCGGGIKKLGCCAVVRYGPFASGIDVFGANIGTDYEGLLLSGEGGGGGGSWSGDARFGGDGNTFGDDGGDNWFDGDANFGGNGDDIGDDDDGNWFDGDADFGGDGNDLGDDGGGGGSNHGPPSDGGGAIYIG